MRKKILFLSNFKNVITFYSLLTKIIRNFKIYYNEKFDFVIYSINNIDDYEETIKNKIHKDLNIKKDNIHTLEPLIKISDSDFDKQYVNYYFTGCKNLHNIILENKPDYIFIMEQISLIKILVNHINKIRSKWFGKILPYTLFDFTNLNNDNLDFYTDIILTTSNYNKYEILKIKPDKNVNVLYPIVSEYFLKINNKDDIMKIRENLYGNENKNKFIIGAFTSNKINKRWDLLLDAFCKFYAIFNNCILVIKTDFLNCNNGFDIKYLINYNLNKYKIKENIIKIITNYLEPNILNHFYNSIDIAISTSDGEELGLVPLELGKIGKLTILPNHSIFNSFYKDYNFNFLIKPHILPSDYVRDNINLENILNSNSYYCIYKNNISFEKNKAKFIKTKLYISKHINTIYVTNNSYDDFEINNNPIKDLIMFRHVKTLNKAFEIIEKLIEDEIPDQFQILISSDLNIIQETYNTLQKYYYKFKNNQYYRNILISEPYVFKNYILNGNNCNLISSSGVYNKLLFYYNNRDILEKEEKEISKLIKEKLNPKIIIDKLVGFFNLH